MGGSGQSPPIGRLEPRWAEDRLGRGRRLDPGLGCGSRPRAEGLVGPSAGVRSVAWSPGGDRIASGGTDLSIRVWDAADGRQLSGQVSTTSSRSISWPGARMRRDWPPAATGTRRSRSGTPTSAGREEHAAGPSGLLGLMGGHALKTWPVPSNNAYSIAWSPDGHQVATTHHDGIVRIWDVNGGPTPRRELSGHRFDVYAVAWSPDGRRLASGGDNQHSRLGRQFRQAGRRAIRAHEAGPWSGVESGRPPDRLGQLRSDRPRLGPHDSVGTAHPGGAYRSGGRRDLEPG